MHFAVDTRQRSIGIDNDGGIMVDAGGSPFEKRTDNHHTAFLSDLTKHFSSWAGDWLRRVKPIGILFLTKVK